MKKWITSLFIITLISGCSTVPSIPKSHPEKYTFQVIGIEIPNEIASDYIQVTKGKNGEEITSSSEPYPEALDNHPKAKITEYPIVIAGIGESVVNDQTKSVSLPEDFTVVDGKAVAKEKNQKLGYMVSIRFDELKDE